MSTLLKVLNGTLPDSFICTSCEHSVIRTFDNNDVSVKCRALGTFMTRRVVKCSMWERKGTNWENLAIASQAYLIAKDSEGNVWVKGPNDRQSRMMKNGKLRSRGRVTRRRKVTVTTNPSGTVVN